LADAGIPMRDLVASCAAGKADNEVVLDLMQEEDNFGEGDLPVGYIPDRDEIVLMQLDGEFTKDEFEKAKKMALEGCKKVYEMQKKALKDKFKETKKGA